MRYFYLGLLLALPLAAQPTGIFETHQDIGINPKPGSTEYDSATNQYRVTGGGANIWSTTDAFQYVWKKISGDVTFSADVTWVGQGAVEHRKATLMLRQTLDADSPYVDVALHGNGMTSLQYRETKQGLTKEIRAAIEGPLHIRIERRDDQFTLFAGGADGKMQSTGPITISLTNPLYAGLAVCSHDANILETAIFSNVKLETKSTERITSVISIFDMQKKFSKVLLRIDHRVEAPNWAPDGKSLIVNYGGDLYRVPLDRPRMDRIDLADVHGVNNDHGISPDSSMFAVSAHGPAGSSQVYLVPSSPSGKPQLMTPVSPSYFHGFAPDGKYLAFVGQRADNFDLYRIPISGGPEERLTSNAGYDDGPDYSPDGNWIYFNSNRSGSWDIWRIPPDGAGQDDARAERVTSDAMEDWFPHPSPDGKWIVFLSFPKGTEGHPPNQHVQIRLLSAIDPAAKPQFLMNLFGGQGTMNVNSWSPDSTRFAFVRYELPE